MTDSRRVEDTLALTRSHFRAPLAVRERVRRELAAQGHFGGEQLEQLHPGRRVPDARATGVSKPLVALLAGLTFAAGLWLGGRHAQESSAPSPVPASALATVAPEATPALGQAPAAEAPAAETAEPAEQPSSGGGRAAAAPAERRPEQPAQSRERRQDSELVLLQRADRALRSGEPELALSFLADLDRRHPDTQFGEERSAVRLMARCARSDVEARTEAQRFVQDRRASVYSDRVRELCGLER